MSRRATPARVLAISLASLGLVVVVVAVSLVVGEQASLSRALAEPGSPDAQILALRIPRTLLGLVVGAALAAAGVAFQALLRNPLADPYVLGVSGGASVAGTAAIVLGAGQGLLGRLTLPVWAFFGAAAAVLLVFAFGRVRGRLVPNVALLAGVVLNALAAAMIVTLRSFATPSAVFNALDWLTGSLATSVDATQLVVLAVYTLIALVVLQTQAVAMNGFALGDDAAHTVGIDVERARRAIFLAASLLTGAAVAVAGPIGFVGIVVPHMLRALIGPDHRALLPAAALIGGAFLVGCDALARVALRVVGREMTVGVVTALIGAPFFLVILRRRGAHRVF